MTTFFRYDLEGNGQGVTFKQASAMGVPGEISSAAFYALHGNTNALFHPLAAKPVLPRWQEPYEPLQALPDAEIVSLYHEALSSSICQFDRSKPVGILLSGGIDSILVASIASHYYDHVELFHMSLGDYTQAETGRAQATARALGLPLHIIDFVPLKASDFDQEISLLYHCVDVSSPGYRRIANAVVERLGVSAVVFNGELNVTDVGFTESSDPTRHFRRWLFHSAFARRILKNGSSKIRLEGSRCPSNKYLSVLYEMAALFVERIEEDEQYYSGIYTGKAHFPGSKATDLRFSDPSGLSARLEDFHATTLPRAPSSFYEYMYYTSQAFYSATTNIMTVQTIFESVGLQLCLPYSSASVHRVSFSLPRRLAKNKWIQKELAVSLYNVPRDAAFYIKSHSKFNPSFPSFFSQTPFHRPLLAKEDRDYLAQFGSGFAVLGGENARSTPTGIEDQQDFRSYVALRALAEKPYNFGSVKTR